MSQTGFLFARLTLGNYTDILELYRYIGTVQIYWNHVMVMIIYTYPPGCATNCTRHTPPLTSRPFRPFHGVVPCEKISQRVTPKLQTSDWCVTSCILMASGDALMNRNLAGVSRNLAETNKMIILNIINPLQCFRVYLSNHFLIRVQSFPNKGPIIS